MSRSDTDPPNIPLAILCNCWECAPILSSHIQPTMIGITQDLHEKCPYIVLNEPCLVPDFSRISGRCCQPVQCCVSQCGIVQLYNLYTVRIQCGQELFNICTIQRIVHWKTSGLYPTAQAHEAKSACAVPKIVEDGSTFRTFGDLMSPNS
jgi:hypothetical protein